MSPNAAVWPCILLGLSAWAIASWRLYVLAWQAPVDAPRFGTALSRRIERGQRSAALALCSALKSCWAAQCAGTILGIEDDGSGLAFAIDDLRARYRLRAQWGVGALGALGRMAFPVALGTAILAMGGASAAPDIASVQGALSVALLCLTLGLSSAVFCRASAVVIRRQGEARMREIAAVCRQMVEALAPATPDAADHP